MKAPQKLKKVDQQPKNFKHICIVKKLQKLDIFRTMLLNTHEIIEKPILGYKRRVQLFSIFVSMFW